jgi:hypothetical protein
MPGQPIAIGSIVVGPGATGNYQIAALTFRPKRVMFRAAAQDPGLTSSISHGIATTDPCLPELAINHNADVDLWVFTGTSNTSAHQDECVHVSQKSSPYHSCQGKVTAWNEDGFTLNISFNTQTVPVFIHYAAIGD